MKCLGPMVLVGHWNHTDVVPGSNYGTQTREVCAPAFELSPWHQITSQIYFF